MSDVLTVAVIVLVFGWMVVMVEWPRWSARRRRNRLTRGVQVIDSPGLPDGYVPPSGSLSPPTYSGGQSGCTATGVCVDHVRMQTVGEAHPFLRPWPRAGGGSDSRSPVSTRTSCDRPTAAA